MTPLSDSTVITVGGIVVLSNLLLTWLQIRMLTKSPEPQPPNQDLDNRLTRHDAEIADHTRRISAIESARAACQQQHMAEIDKLYKRINTTAERLAEIAGRIEEAFRHGRSP